MSLSTKQRNNQVQLFDFSEHLTDPNIKIEIIRENDIKTLESRKIRLKKNIDMINKLRTKFNYSVNFKNNITTRGSNTIPIPKNKKIVLKSSKTMNVGDIYAKNNHIMYIQKEEVNRSERKKPLKNNTARKFKNLSIKINLEDANQKETKKISKFNTEENRVKNGFFMTNIVSPIRSPKNLDNQDKLPNINFNNRHNRSYLKTIKYKNENIPLLELNQIKDTPIKNKAGNNSLSMSEETGNILSNKLLIKKKEETREFDYNKHFPYLPGQHIRSKTIIDDANEYNDIFTQEMELKYNLLSDKDKLNELGLKTPKKIDKISKLFNKIYKTDEKFRNDIFKLQQIKNLPLIDYQNKMVRLLSLRMSKENLRKLSINLKDVRNLAEKVDILPNIDWKEISQQIKNARYKKGRIINQTPPNKTKLTTDPDIQKLNKSKVTKSNESFNRMSNFLPDFLVEKFRSSLKFKY